MEAVSSFISSSWKTAEDTITNISLANYGRQLYSAAESADISSCRQLLDEGASPNWQAPHNGRSPLHISASNGYYEITELLVAKGGDSVLRDNEGNTPLHLAIANQENKVIKLLLETVVVQLSQAQDVKLQLEEELEDTMMGKVEAERRMLQSEQQVEELEMELDDMSRVADRKGRGEGKAVHRWYRVYRDGKREVIRNGAEGDTYAPTSSDLKCMLRHEIEYQDDGDKDGRSRRGGGGGGASGSRVPASNRGGYDERSPSGRRNDNPYMGVKEVKIISAGRYHTSLLTVDATVGSNDRPARSLHQWYRGDKDGQWIAIDGAVQESYQPSIDDISCLIRCSYIPVNDEGEKGSRMYAQIGPLEIEPKVREIVSSYLTSKEHLVDVYSKDLGKNVSLLLLPHQLKVREGKNTKLKHGYHAGFKVHLHPVNTNMFTVNFNDNVRMEFEVSTPRDRDLVCLAIRSFCLLFLKKNQKRKGRRR